VFIPPANIKSPVLSDATQLNWF